MKPDILDTHQKALQVNLDSAMFGTFDEYGEGQEVARWFCRVGGSSATIARAVSCYEMPFADDIPSACERQVSQAGLEATLDHDYRLVLERFDVRRGSQTTFFAFASRVSVRTQLAAAEPQGWVGIRFQSRPRSAPSQVVIHLRLLDRNPSSEQEVVGVIGVNLVYAVRHFQNDPEALLLSLLDNPAAARVKLDFVKFSGPDFAAVDNRALNLKLAELAGPGHPNRPRNRRNAKSARGGLIDSVHLAGMPVAA
jgi:hypothetical protein